jgi:hypothetical protein
LRDNTTYKLLGVFWDGKPEYQGEIEYCPRDDILDYRYKRELFDNNDFFRKVDLSELLNVENGEILAKIKAQTQNCDKVFVKKDVVLRSGNPVLERFLEKRSRQAVQGLMDELT